jgi:competence protein ComEC
MTMPKLGPLPVAIAMAAGIAAAPMLDRLGLDPWVRWLAAAAIAALWRRHRGVILVAALALGAARGARPAVAPPDGALADDRIVDRVTGIIRGPIVHRARGDGARLETGGAVIWLWAGERLVAGERIAATGVLRTPRGLWDPAVVDRGDAVRARGAELEMSARDLERLGDGAGPLDRAWRWADATQARWARAIDEVGRTSGHPTGAAALRGITVGDRRAVPAALDQRWRAVGIYHVLSVSGLHLAVVAGLAFGLLRRLVAASPWGGQTRPVRWAAPPALVLAIGYTLITGAQLATLRALLVIALVLLAQVADRPIRLVDALGAAGLVILAWRPADLVDPSFQLSFTAALTLALRPAGARGVRGWIARSLASSAWVALTTAPLTAYHFHQVSVGGVVGNLVLTPIVELVALPLGLAGLVLGVAPAIAGATWLVGLADRGAGALATVMPVGHVAVASVATMAVLVALAIIASVLRRGPRRAIAWLALSLVWSLGRTPPPADALRITFLDVGQGDAALLELPDGEVWLVDAGGQASARELAHAAAPGRAIDRVLAAYGHARIDLAILSHPHPDHYLGLAAIEAPITELWTADSADADLAAERRPQRPGLGLPGFPAIAAGLAARGTRLAHPALGIARAAGGVTLTVWAPRYQPLATAGPRCAADPVRTVNDNSLVVAIGYRGRTVLFAGDLEAEGEDELVAAGLGQVDVVKVPHHGSPTSSTDRFVAATRPALAVISCGHVNAFGFPSAAVVERWRAVGAAVARTDRDGAVRVTIGGDGGLAIEHFAP